jgi:chromate transporter
MAAVVRIREPAPPAETAAVPLARALHQPWQFAVLAGALVLTLALRRGPLLTLLAAAAAGIAIVLAGGPLPL